MNLPKALREMCSCRGLVPAETRTTPYREVLWLDLPGCNSLGTTLRSLLWCWSPLPDGSGSPLFAEPLYSLTKRRCLRHFEGCGEKTALAGAAVLKSMSSWLAAAASHLVLPVLSAGFRNISPSEGLSPASSHQALNLSEG